ncbi:MAG: epoxide hydrolase family protein [Knoellia sp.]
MDAFTVSFDPEMIDDLRDRLSTTRWPAHGVDDGWSRGIPPGYLRELAEYWRGDFDFAAAERALNRHPQFVESVSGLELHFYHLRSGRPDAVAVILTHGWPSTSAEFLAVMDEVQRSNATGPGVPIDLVVPTLPRHGATTAEPGSTWDVARIARAWAELMSRLGHERYVAVGGDWGSLVSLELARQQPQSVIGVLCSMLLVPPPGDDDAELTDADRQRLDDWGHFDVDLSGYLKVQSTRPATVGFGLNDSPVGQLAWTMEKFKEWNRHNELPEDRIDRDQLLAIATLYWAHMSAAGSAHLYFDSGEHLAQLFQGQADTAPLSVPMGVTALLADTTPPVESLVRRMYPSIVHWNEHANLGHFAALEDPSAFAAELRAFVLVLGDAVHDHRKTNEKECLDVASAR